MTKEFLKVWYLTITRIAVEDDRDSLLDRLEVLLTGWATDEWGKGTDIYFDREDFMCLIQNGKRRELINVKELEEQDVANSRRV